MLKAESENSLPFVIYSMSKFIMRPQAYNFNCLLFFENLIYEPVFYIDAPRICSISRSPL